MTQLTKNKFNSIKNWISQVQGFELDFTEAKDSCYIELENEDTRYKIRISNHENQKWDGNDADVNLINTKSVIEMKKEINEELNLNLELSTPKAKVEKCSWCGKTAKAKNKEFLKAWRTFKKEDAISCSTSCAVRLMNGPK